MQTQISNIIKNDCKITCTYTLSNAVTKAVYKITSNENDSLYIGLYTLSQKMHQL